MLNRSSFRSQSRLQAAQRRMSFRIRHTPDAFRGNVGPAEDSQQTAATFQQSPDRQGRLLFGKILFAMPYTHWYRVAVDGLRSEMVCCALSETSSNPFGVRNTSILDTGSPVLVWAPPNVHYGVVLGCVPPMAANGMSFSDWIAQGSPTGFRREAYYNQFRQLFVGDGGVIDFSNSRPVDGTCIGEWGRMTALGGGLFMDPFMQFFRLDEMCGLSMFYMDRLVRLAGHNFDFRSAGMEESFRDDVGEIMEYRGSTPYAWEALGARGHATKVWKENDDAAIHYDLLEGKYEPQTPDQQPIYRWEEFGGYLGQGRIRQLSMPLPGQEGLNQTSSPGQIGLFREQVSLDGQLAIQSAHSIFISKRILIPVPQRKKLVEDPTGDETENYKFASVTGDGPDHKVKALPKGVAGDGLLSAAAACDLAAHVYNWKGLHPFHYHSKDFDLPEEAEGSPFVRLQTPPDFGSLRTKQRLETPTPIKVSVDHRYGATEYYETTAGFFLLPDGSVSIRDGYGSEFLMSRGEIFLNAAASVWLRPGKSVIAYAGRDVILRAKNSIDVYASDHDVRIKAQKNLELLAGNGGATGRLLLDCQSSGAINDVKDKQGEDVAQSGIILSSKKAGVSVLGGNVYVRTGGGDAFKGSVIIDAAGGDAQFQVIASAATLHTNQGLDVAIPAGVNASEKTVVHHLGPNVVQLPTGVVIGNGLTVTERGIQVKGNINGINSVISSDGNHTGSYQGKLGNLKPGSPGYAITEVNVQSQLVSFNTRKNQMSESRERIRENWQTAPAIGSDETIDATAFSPRNDVQLAVEDFSLPETYWQQLYRLYSQTDVAGWTENPIQYQGQAMYPHPGKKAWADEKTFQQFDLVLFDVTEGKDKPRGDGLYEAPELATPTAVKLNGNYPVF